MRQAAACRYPGRPPATHNLTDQRNQHAPTWFRKVVPSSTPTRSLRVVLMLASARRWCGSPPAQLPASLPSSSASPKPVSTAEDSEAVKPPNPLSLPLS